MTYDQLTRGLSVAQRGAVAEHLDTITEYLSQVEVYRKRGLSLKDFVRSALADDGGVWPDSVSEVITETDPELEELVAALDDLDAQLKTLHPITTGLMLANE